MAWQGREYDWGYASPPRITPAARALLIVTVAVFVVELILGLPFVGIFGLTPALAVGRLCLWQFVTYIFLHSPADPFHIIFNMLMLYFFGPMAERALGRRRFVWFYIAAGVFAGIVHSAVGFFRAPNIPVVGASGSLYAILVLCAMLSPNQLVILFVFPMKLKNMVLLFVGINVFVTLRVGMGGMIATLAHLGGAAFGFLYFKLKVQRGMTFAGRWGGWLSTLRQWRERRRRLRERDEDDRVEELLAKISREGMDSLTDAERTFLTEAARRRRERKW
ncbi:MAG: rhomboid family intramembrane serine protease [Planctomycetota bacterium]